eukprot:5889015-Pleurochrysis_carterae.AAC.2
MPVDAVNSSGITLSLLLRDVRCVPTFSDSLLSVSQLWESSFIGCRFGGAQAMPSPPCIAGERLSLPFSRYGGLYVWRVLLRDFVSPSFAARAIMVVNASHSRHHMDVMSPNDATVCVHRRLHLGASKLRRLPSSTAPPSLSSDRLDGWTACTEANSVILPYKGKALIRRAPADPRRYRWPFVRTQHGDC